MVRAFAAGVTTHSAPEGTPTVVAMAQGGTHQNAQAGETTTSLRFGAFKSGLRRPSSGAARLLLGATVLVSAVPACSFLHAHEGPPRAAFVFHSPGRHGERRAACSPMPRSVPGYAASRMPVRSPAPPAPTDFESILPKNLRSNTRTPSSASGCRRRRCGRSACPDPPACCTRGGAT